MIGIIGAMKEEVNILKKLIENQKQHHIMHVEFTTGTLHGQDVVLLESGIGKVNVAIATTLLLEKFNATMVINTGSAGGVSFDAEIGDVVISLSVAYHDVDVTGFGYAIGQVPNLPATFMADDDLIKKVETILKNQQVRYMKGQVVTGDAFVNRPEQIEKIKNHFSDAVALEMEAAAVAHVCHVAKVPFIVIRALSDIAGKVSHVSFEEFLPLAAKHSSEIVAKLVENL